MRVRFQRQIHEFLVADAAAAAETRDEVPVNQMGLAQKIHEVVPFELREIRHGRNGITGRPGETVANSRGETP